MPPLDPKLRNSLEKRIVEARGASEAAARVALEALAVHESKPYESLSPDDRGLRKLLRAKAKVLGGHAERDLSPLVEELAYVRWHRFLFARFLAENGLLMHPEYEGVSVSMADCAELAPEEGDADGWMTASRYAQSMLPDVFRPDDPLFSVRFFPEGRRAMILAMEGIPKPAFSSDDCLGWTYQFWQTKAKKEVNASGRKIGGHDLPAVTQLFTEDYMVEFLLHNSLGAWYAARNPDSPLVGSFSYLRWNEDAPESGSEPENELHREPEPELDGGAGIHVTAGAGGGGGIEAGIPSETPAEIRASGTPADRVSVEVPSEVPGGTPASETPASGIPAEVSAAEVRASEVSAVGLPAGVSASETPFSGTPAGVRARTPAAGGFEGWPDTAAEVTVLDPCSGSGHFLVAAADMLARMREEEEGLSPAEAAEAVLRENIFGLELDLRCAQIAAFSLALWAWKRGGHRPIPNPHVAWSGTPAGGTADEWAALAKGDLDVARLGSGAFETIGGEVVNVALLALTNTPADTDHRMSGLDVSDSKTPREKADALRAAPASVLPQSGQLENPDARVTVEEGSGLPLLSEFAHGVHGLGTKDAPRFVRCFWENRHIGRDWELMQSTVDSQRSWGGLEHMVFWERGEGRLHELGKTGDAILAGAMAWGKPGVTVSQMRSLPASIASKEIFDKNVAVVLPKDESHVEAIWAFCSSPEFHDEVRKIDQKMNVTNATLVKVPFDLERWQKVAEERYPDGLPEPYSDDPTQWLFHGHPARASEGTALHVAAARLLGYRWPAEADGEAERMGLSREGREWVARAAARLLDGHTDPDGIVCLPAVAGERPAAERLRALLAAAWEDAPDGEAGGGGWTHSVLERLLSEAGSGGGDIGSWLWRDFFKGHARLFHNRPFVWHITDGRRDGFSALVNYHKLDYRLLGRLIYTYLGAWIEAQKSAAEAGEAGADSRLAAALDLRKRLIEIQEGESPHDIYIRWKPTSEQPVGWHPDMNDGVRLNIRPFVEAGVLRSKFTINWKKDRGRNPDGTERENNEHLTIAEKEEARGAISG